MSSGGETQQPDVLLMAEVANYSGFPSNSDDTDWNWTQTEPSVIVAARSTGFQVAIVVILSFLIVSGTLLNLVTVVTHLHGRRPVIATDGNGLHRVQRGPLQTVAVVTHLQIRLTALRVNILALNLACCDLLRSTVSAPLLLLSVISRRWPSGLLGCRWYLALSILFGTTSLNTVTAIAIDRQVNVISYMLPPQHISLSDLISTVAAGLSRLTK